jgi:alkyldihydroxyacetonephosphate synthase
MRWNGWGEESESMSLPPSGSSFLTSKVGESKPLPSASWEEALARVPASRIEIEHPLISVKPEDRLVHARGQSLPDWLAKKSGELERFPDAMAFPESREEVAELMALASEHQWHVIPFGGGTSVVGHINVPVSQKPVLTISMARMNQLLKLDETSLLATFGAGTTGPDLEAQLRAHGYTLGHFPQSFEFSTVGGWVAARSSGQQSLRYGRIEQLFAGGHMETMRGGIDMTSLPASAAASDFRQHVLGSEGRLGIITDVDVRVSRLPASETFGLAFFPSWEQGSNCIREMVQQRIPFSMLRLSNPVETNTQLLLSITPDKRKWLDRAIKLFGIGDTPCMLLYGITGDEKLCQLSAKKLKQHCKQHKGWLAGPSLAKHWSENRFRSTYLRETLWDMGLLIDTMETATRWSELEAMMGHIEGALKEAIKPFGDKIHVFTHLSHCYNDGATVYTSYVFRPGGSYEEALKKWQALKHAASTAIVENGGTISHQHGVGKDHAPYLEREKGKLPMEVLKSGFETLDPDQLMNPGVICD